MRTGGGPPVHKKVDPVIERVKTIICWSTSSLAPRYDSDSRYQYLVEEPVEVEREIPVSEDTVIIDFHDASSSATMWDGWNPSILRNPTHPALRVTEAADGRETVEEDRTTPDPGTTPEPRAGPSNAVPTEELRQTRKRKRPRTVHPSNETRGLYNELAVDKKKLVAVQRDLLEVEKLKMEEERGFRREEHNRRLKLMDLEEEIKREKLEFKREEQEFKREEHRKRMLLLDLEISKMS